MRKMLAAVLAAVPMLGSAACAGGRNPLPDAGGLFLSYVNNPAAAGVITKSPELNLAVGGNAPVRAVMDTGSTGIVIAQDAVGNPSGLVNLGPGSISYSSSGKVMSGWTAQGVATISDRLGHAVTTTPIPILVVQKITCLANARHCTDGAPTAGIAMIGIGFGRQQKNGDSAFTPGRNPFLHVESQQDGSVRRGYVVTTTGVQVGVNPAQVAGLDFRLVSLTPDTAHPGDWLPQAATMTLDGRSFSDGQVLVDTGVTDMFLTLSFPATSGRTVTACENRRQKRPSVDAVTCRELEQAAAPVDYTSWTTLAPGTRLAIGIPAPGGARPLAASYSIKMGGRKPMTPDRLLLVGNLAPPTADAPARSSFVNTSVRFLNGYSYLFDDSDGLVGYRRYTPASPAG